MLTSRLATYQKTKKAFKLIENCAILCTVHNNVKWQNILPLWNFKNVKTLNYNPKPSSTIQTERLESIIPCTKCSPRGQKDIGWGWGGIVLPPRPRLKMRTARQINLAPRQLVGNSFVCVWGGGGGSIFLCYFPSNWSLSTSTLPTSPPPLPRHLVHFNFFYFY